MIFLRTSYQIKFNSSGVIGNNAAEGENSGIRKAVRHARMAHKATKWPIKKILTGPVMRPDRTKLVK